MACRPPDWLEASSCPPATVPVSDQFRVALLRKERGNSPRLDGHDGRRDHERRRKPFTNRRQKPVPDCPSEPRGLVHPDVLRGVSNTRRDCNVDVYCDDKQVDWIPDLRTED